ncbi:hypothetical protein ACFVYR_35985 [Streptomyces sp. NPDC058284]|uniref:hypothetical protein n=1 Tax=unclassified Streptomyces TaxID=2593676 RepID=UPI003649E543
MSEHKAPDLSGSGIQHHDAAVPFSQSVVGGSVSAAAVAAAWGAESLNVVPPALAVAVAGCAVGGQIGWAVLRSRKAERAQSERERLARARHAETVAALVSERDTAVRALEEVLRVTAQGRQHLQWALEEVTQGRAEARFTPAEAPRPTGDLRHDALAAVAHSLTEAWQTVMTGAVRTQQSFDTKAELAEILKTVAPRLLTLVTRGLHRSLGAQRMVEDPDLLQELYVIDHLFAQLRRASESLLVLSGNSVNHKSKALGIRDLLRRAVSEIPEYHRARLGQLPSTQGVVGYAVPDVTEIVAALTQNATDYSSDKVEIHAHLNREGLVIEILDRGDIMSAEKRATLNRLLERPDLENPLARLREGQTGLLVAALQGHRHHIRIHLQPNLVGGTRAVVAVPSKILVESPEVASRPVWSTSPAPGSTAPAAPSPTPRTSTSGEVSPAASVSSAQGTERAPSRALPALPQRTRPVAAAPTPAPEDQLPPREPTADLMASFQARQGRPAAHTD